MSLIVFHLLAILSLAEEPTNVGELYATIDANIESILLSSFLPPGYALPSNVYDWNVSEMVTLINQKDPEIMYAVETELLFTVFPEYFISQLPRDILIAHELYYYLPSNNTNCNNTTNCTNVAMTRPPINKIDPCYGPFVHTKYDGVFTFPNGSRTFQCALRCEHTQVLWNLTDTQMDIIDICWWCYSIPFLIMCIIIVTNISMDIKFHKQKCCQRQFLFLSPIFIVAAYTIVALIFLIPLIIGKDTVTCDDDLNGVKTFGSYKPGGSPICTVCGIIFYSTVMVLGGYTSLFSLSLWSQFFAPLNGVWNELKEKSYCKYCCAILDIFPSCNNITNPCDFYNCNRFCSTHAFKHYIIWIISAIYTIAGINDRAIQGAPAIGLCTIGTRDKAQTMKYNTIPHSIFLMLTMLFLPCAITLLIRLAKAGHADDVSKKAFKNLKWRLLVFFLAVLFSWFSIVFVLGFVFHAQRGKFEDAAEVRTKCMLIASGTGQSYDKCMKGFTFYWGWYVFTGVSLPTAGIGSLVLSCNEGNYRRWRIIYDFVIHCGKDTSVFKRLAEVVSLSRHDNVGSKSATSKKSKGSKASSNGCTATPGSKAETAHTEIELRVSNDVMSSPSSPDEIPDPVPPSPRALTLDVTPNGTPEPQETK